MISPTEEHPRSKGPRSSAIHQLRVKWVGVEPQVWRRIVVPGNARFGWFHAVLQLAMAWTLSVFE